MIKTSITVPYAKKPKACPVLEIEGGAQAVEEGDMFTVTTVQTTGTNTPERVLEVVAPSGSNLVFDVETVEADDNYVIEKTITFNGFGLYEYNVNEPPFEMIAQGDSDNIVDLDSGNTTTITGNVLNFGWMIAEEGYFILTKNYAFTATLRFHAKKVIQNYYVDEGEGSPNGG